MMRRFARLALRDGRTRYAEAEGARWHLLTDAPWRGGSPSGEDVGDEAIAHRRCPVAPSKIVCVGRNYAEHARELGNEVPDEPLLFFKPPSSLLDPDGVIVLPPARLSQRVEHEVELGVVVGERLHRVGEERAARAIFGYTAVGDITARDLQRREGQWTRAKGMDTFCPVGPEVVAGIDASRLPVRCLVDGELRQDGNTAQMVFSPAALLAFISDAMTLEPGDLVATGTPAGVGPIAAGQRLELSIPPIPPLVVRVEAARDG